MALHKGECSRCKLFFTWHGTLAVKDAWCPHCRQRLVRTYGPTRYTHTHRDVAQLRKAAPLEP